MHELALGLEGLGQGEAEVLSLIKKCLAAGDD